MGVQLQEKQDGRIVKVHVSGKLTAEDYETFTPQVERAIDRHGKVRLLFDMHDFLGWEASALWEDIKFGLGHFRDVERLAMVGETKWQAGMAAFCKPFTLAEIRYFDRADAAKANAWIEADLKASAPTAQKDSSAASRKEAAVASGV